MSARDRQVGGDHYMEMGVQPWDALASWLTPEEFRGYLKGSAINYLTGRKKGADPREDIGKAVHCLERLLEELPEPPPARATCPPDLIERLQKEAMEARR